MEANQLRIYWYGIRGQANNAMVDICYRPPEQEKEADEARFVVRGSFTIAAMVFID